VSRPPGRGRAAAGQQARRDPFADLGLAAGPGLTDDEVRAAWRRIAAATHPDRADGGDPGRYAVAAAAYTELRTRYGRGEALAVLAPAEARARGSGPARRPPAPARHPGRHPGRPAARFLARLPGRAARGRPVRLALRVAGVAAVAWVALVAGAPPGAGPAVAAGAVTWLVLTARHDLAP